MVYVLFSGMAGLGIKVRTRTGKTGEENGGQSQGFPQGWRLGDKRGPEGHQGCLVEQGWSWDLSCGCCWGGRGPKMISDKKQVESRLRLLPALPPSRS